MHKNNVSFQEKTLYMVRPAALVADLASEALLAGRLEATALSSQLVR